MIEYTIKHKGETISWGEYAFYIYQTHGLPLEYTWEILYKELLKRKKVQLNNFQERFIQNIKTLLIK